MALAHQGRGHAPVTSDLPKPYVFGVPKAASSFRKSSAFFGQNEVRHHDRALHFLLAVHFGELQNQASILSIDVLGHVPSEEYIYGMKPLGSEKRGDGNSAPRTNNRRVLISSLETRTVWGQGDNETKTKAEK